MSTNPFRRSSLKDPGSGTARSTSDFIADATPSAPLAIETRVATSSQKHVNFASPPDLISPVSYPPSPESNRFSPGLQTALPVGQTTANYGDLHLSGNPQELHSNEDADSVLEQAQQNARYNSMIEAYKSAQGQRTQDEAVKDTLSRFAGGPREAANAQTSEEKAAGKSPRQTLDVDAFKRLLLTGESGATTPRPTWEAGLSSSTSQNVSDGSSFGDSSSLSQQSVSETLPATTGGSPHSVYSELEDDRANSNRRSSHTTSPRPTAPTEARKKPAPPKPRHGKLLSEKVDTLNSDINLPQRIGETTSTSSSTIVVGDRVNGDEVDSSRFSQPEVKKLPPAPPLARRRSQNTKASKPALTRNSSSRTTISITSDTPSSPPLQPRAVPPTPPPTRRQNSTADRRSSIDLPSTAEEEDETLRSAQLDSTSHAPARVSSSGRRISTGTTGVLPPLPPPRRIRGSSRGSIDSQRPSLSSLETPSDAQGDINRGEANGGGIRHSAQNAHAIDIMADLAALQQEVDAARRYA